VRLERHRLLPRRRGRGQVNKDAAWYYPEPKPEAANIAGYIAFWKGVKVEG